MAVNITAVLREGYRRSVQRNGLALVGIPFVLYAISGESDVNDQFREVGFG